MNLCCITTFFNPAGYKGLTDNYFVFANNLRKQGADLFTYEVAFGEDPFYLDGIKIRSNSIMWLKERLINYAIETLPAKYDAVAWIDADLLFEDGWLERAISLLKKSDVIQLFKRVFYLPRGHKSYNGEIDLGFQGIVAQSRTHRNWLEQRRERDIKFAAPGFAWAARREFKVYDRDVIGGGDCIFADYLMNSWDLHGFDIKYNDMMKKDVKLWCNKKHPRIDYLPVDIFHLWHGDLRNRKYVQRHKILRDHEYNPDEDVIIKNGVFEWNTPKEKMHLEIENYFKNRMEDL